MAEPTFRDIRCRRDHDTLVITFNLSEIRGDEVGDSLRQEFHDAVDHFGCVKLVLDFAGVRFLTSTAFRPLISLHRKIREKNGRMVFCNLSPEIAEVFLVTRLISTSRSSVAPFEMATDLPDAFSRLRHYTRRLQQGVLVLTLTDPELHGEDLAETLTQELSAAVNEAGAPKVALDCQHVEAMTTPCMRPLLALNHQLKTKNGRLILCNLSPFVAEVLTVTRLISNGTAPAPLRAAPTVAEAIAVLNS
jgi:anti-anti-sigma factor